MTTMTTRKPHHPVVDRMTAERHADIQLRVADRITAFAGSMPFVYLHAIVFGIWMLVFEKSPWPTLTLVVSLEAIYITLFIGLGQKLQDKSAAAHAQADKAEATKAEAHREQIAESQSKLLEVNTDLTQTVAKLTDEIHHHLGIPDSAAG